ncbi:MAG: hypothetical protein DHS20C20_15900 [Ardenticatenaceae bacterium]|nr:MAG: hypothetical protein DHS20C20_15900 [Ardenticatenaceae bacterium]
MHKINRKDAKDAEIFSRENAFVLSASRRFKLLLSDTDFHELVPLVAIYGPSLPLVFVIPKTKKLFDMDDALCYKVCIMTQGIILVNLTNY